MDVVLVNVVNTDVSVVSILDVKQISTLLGVVDTAEEDIDFLECGSLCLWDHEDDEDDEDEIGGHEEVE